MKEALKERRNEFEEGEENWNRTLFPSMQDRRNRQY
jgi:hypothetical protein